MIFPFCSKTPVYGVTTFITSPASPKEPRSKASTSYMMEP